MKTVSIIRIIKKPNKTRNNGNIKNVFNFVPKLTGFISSVYNIEI